MYIFQRIMALRKGRIEGVFLRLFESQDGLIDEETNRGKRNSLFFFPFLPIRRARNMERRIRVEEASYLFPHYTVT